MEDLKANRSLGAKTMLEIKELVLTPGEVENLIRVYEEANGVTSEVFLCDQRLREEMDEDDVFEWEALIEHRNALKELHDNMHREYLKRVSEPQGGGHRKPAARDKILLAA